MKTSETTNCNNNDGDGDGVKLSETSSSSSSSSNENVTTQEEASIQQRMIAGSIGALVTSLVVTPLEVVKVRQQALSKSSSNSSSSNSNVKGNLLNEKSVMKQRLCKPTKSTSTTAVLTSSSASAANIKRCPDCGIFIFNNGIMDSVLPKSSVPSYFASITPPSLSSSHRNKNKIKVSDMSTFQLLRYIFQREGLRNGIYAGLTPTLVMSIPNTVVYFTMYDEISYFLRQYKKTDITVANNNVASSVLIPFLSGSLARFMATLVTAPLELVRTQQAFRASLQNNNSTIATTNNNSQFISSSSSASSSCGVHNKVSKNKVSSTSTTKITRFCSSSSSCIHHPQRNIISSSSSVSSSPNNLIQEFKQIIQKEGYSTLYKGLAPTLWRDVPFSGIYWLGVEFFKGKLNEIQQDQQKQLSDNGALVVQKSMNAFIAGLGAGMIASFFTTPFDVLKTRQQVNMLQEVTEIEKQLQQAQQLKSHSSINANTSRSTFQLLGKIYKEEGVVGLWRGNNARMMKVAPACAIMIFFYEFGKQVS